MSLSTLYAYNFCYQMDAVYFLHCNQQGTYIPKNKCKTSLYHYNNKNPLKTFAFAYKRLYTILLRKHCVRYNNLQCKEKESRQGYDITMRSIFP